MLELTLMMIIYIRQKTEQVGIITYSAKTWIYPPTFQVLPFKGIVEQLISNVPHKISMDRAHLRTIPTFSHS